MARMSGYESVNEFDDMPWVVGGGHEGVGEDVSLLLCWLTFVGHLCGPMVL